MKVSDALQSRITCRAFLPDPVPAATVRAILDGAKQAPSGGNLQPWWVWVLAGEPLQAFREEIQRKMAANPQGEEPEYHVYPPGLKEPYRSRRFKCGEDLYATIGIPRENKPARLMQLAKNFDFFGAQACQRAVNVLDQGGEGFAIDIIVGDMGGNDICRQSDQHFVRAVFVIVHCYLCVFGPIIILSSSSGQVRALYAFVACSQGVT